jgi:putative ABC transport system permease protein
MIDRLLSPAAPPEPVAKSAIPVQEPIAVPVDRIDAIDPIDAVEQLADRDRADQADRADQPNSPSPEHLDDRSAKPAPAWLSAIQRRIPLGWLQLRHDRGRLLTALAGIAFADLAMFMQLGFQNALYDSNTRLNRAITADIVLISPQARNVIGLSNFTRRRLFQAKAIPGVANVDPLYVTVSNWKNPETRQERQILVLGSNPDRPAFQFPELAQFRNELKLQDRYVFDRAARGEYAKTIAQLDRGQPVTTDLEHKKINVVGTYKLGASFAADGSLITSDRNFLRAFRRRDPGSVSIGLIYLEPGADPVSVKNQIRAALPQDVNVLTKAEFVQFEKDYWTKNTAIGFIFNFGVTLGFGIGVIIVYQVLSTDVNDHIREYATLKAMGYRHRFFIGVILEEAVILAIIGFIPSLAVSAGLYAMTRNATNLPMFMTLGRCGLVLAATFAMCCISGAIASRRLQAADPADMF